MEHVLADQFGGVRTAYLDERTTGSRERRVPGIVDIQPAVRVVDEAPHERRGEAVNGAAADVENPRRAGPGIELCAEAGPRFKRVALVTRIAGHCCTGRIAAPVRWRIGLRAQFERQNRSARGCARAAHFPGFYVTADIGFRAVVL
uniref:Uncharacterized protein n=1 Tax=Burkholderia sp. M701 TaxID=326454 RepID=V5YPG6_9BURK|nr:hypothetical protein [Burkholderia sp. M701]